MCVRQKRAHPKIFLLLLLDNEIVVGLNNLPDTTILTSNILRPSYEVQIILEKMHTILTCRASFMVVKYRLSVEAKNQIVLYVKGQSWLL